MNYWLHRCENHHSGGAILDKEQRLTIGFSACANSEEMVHVVEKKDGIAFDNLYRAIYGGEIWRARWSLWYFTCEMEEGDIVVIPRYDGFTVGKLLGSPIRSERRNVTDIGWEWNIELLVPKCAPRESFATSALLSRMKCRQTTLNIGDLGTDVEQAIQRFREQKPFSLPGELADKCHDLLDKDGSPSHFERLLRDYFARLGATVTILSKNYGGKIGDCDVAATFPALKLTISVQAKFHSGKTGDWAVRQIAEYAKDNQEKSGDPNWTYANWVVSFGDDFTEEAKEKAQQENVLLINGREFCEMLVANGLGLGD